MIYQRTKNLVQLAPVAFLIIKKKYNYLLLLLCHWVNMRYTLYTHKIFLTLYDHHLIYLYNHSTQASLKRLNTPRRSYVLLPPHLCTHVQIPNEHYPTPKNATLGVQLFCLLGLPLEQGLILYIPFYI